MPKLKGTTFHLNKENEDLKWKLAVAEAELVKCNQRYEALMVWSRKTINTYRELLGMALAALKMSPMPDDEIFRAIEEKSGALHE